MSFKCLIVVFTVWRSSKKALRPCMMFLNLIYRRCRKRSQQQFPMLPLVSVTAVAATYMALHKILKVEVVFIDSSRPRLLVLHYTFHIIRIACPYAIIKKVSSQYSRCLNLCTINYLVPVKIIIYDKLESGTT